MNLPFKELGDLVTTGGLSVVTASCLGTSILGGSVLCSSSSLCLLALLSLGSTTSSCGGVVGSTGGSGCSLGLLALLSCGSSSGITGSSSGCVGSY